MSYVSPKFAALIIQLSVIRRRFVATVSDVEGKPLKDRPRRLQ